MSSLVFRSISHYLEHESREQVDDGPAAPRVERCYLFRIQQQPQLGRYLRGPGTRSVLHRRSPSAAISRQLNTHGNRASGLPSYIFVHAIGSHIQAGIITLESFGTRHTYTLSCRRTSS